MISTRDLVAQLVLISFVADAHGADPSHKSVEVQQHLKCQMGHAARCSLSSLRTCCESIPTDSPENFCPQTAHQTSDAAHQQSPANPCDQLSQQICAKPSGKSCNELSPVSSTHQPIPACCSDLHLQLSIAVSAPKKTCQARSPSTPFLPEQGPSSGAAKNSRG